jgi:hypothetical protein
VIPIVIIPVIRQKLLTRHNVKENEVEECFLNIEGQYLYDTRAKHITNPLSEWFISKTNRDRILKVIFVHEDGNLMIKSAYEPEPAAIEIYSKRFKVIF